MRLGIIWLLLSFCTLINLSASPPDTLAAHELFETAKSLRDSKQYLESARLLIEARDGFMAAAAQNDQAYCWERAIKAAGIAVGNYLLAEKFARGDSIARNSIAAFPEGVLKQSKQTRSLYGNWARCYYYLQQFDQAAALYEDLLQAERQRVPIDSNVIQRVLTDITYSYRAAGKLEQMMGYSEQALTWAQVRADTINIAIIFRSMAGMANRFGEINKADSLYKLAVNLLETYSQSDLKSLMMAHGDYSGLLLRRGFFREALVYAQLSLQEAEEYAGQQHPSYADGLIEIGNCYMAIRDFSMAKSYLFRSLDIFLQAVGENHTRVADIYTKLSKIYFAQLEQEQGFEYQERAVRIREKVLGKNNRYTVNHYGNLGWAYLEMGRYEESMAVYEKTIAMSLSFKPVNQYAVAYMENNLGRSYEKLDRFDEAEATHKRALMRKQAIFEPNHIQIAISVIHLAYLQQRKGDFEQAKQLFDEAVNMTASFVPFDSIYHAESLLAVVQWAYASKDYRLGTQYLQQAEALLQANSLSILQERLKLRELQVKTFLALGELENALAKIALADQEIAEVLPRLQERKGRLELKKIAHFLYLKGVSSCYQLYQKTQAQSWLTQAFKYAESAKATVLYQEMHELALEQKGLLPPHIAQFESDIRSRDHFLNEQLLELQNLREQDVEEVARVKSALLRTRIQTDSLFNVLENQYPQYYQLRVKTPRLGLAFIQSQLADNQSLLEYLVDEDQVWVFVIGADKVDLVPLRGTLDLAPLVDQLRISVSATSQEAASHQKYLSAANELYNLLVKPITVNIKSEVILIPDDILSYLPFECLLSQPADPREATHQLAFWLKDKTISYAYSASLWAQGRKKRRFAPKGLLAVAPIFKDTQNEIASSRGDYLGPLMASRSEAKSVAQIWQGETLLDSMASVQNFAAVASQYQIIHLATHGKILDDVAGRTFLAFYGSDDTLRLGERLYPQVQALYLADLFSLRLHSDLVVLSACETGLGKLYKGEGVASLARGFTYAGAGSILNTLWSVSDEGSKMLMERFYYHLNQSHSRSAALRLAKLDLIETRPEFSKPFYWAGYILVGDERVIKPQSQGHSIFYLLALIGGALILGLAWQSSHKKRQT
ncbi:MAG: CHAT domain-containing protein [Bacteroidia bacterium]